MKRSTWIAAGVLGVVCAGVIAAHSIFEVSALTPKDASRTIAAPTAQDESAEILHAYLRHWSVFAEAMARLDDSNLDEVFGGTALATITDQVRQAARAKTAAAIRVSRHRYRIKVLSDTLASVDDTYLDQSSWNVGGKPSPPGPPTWEHRTFTLSKEEGSWKVTDIISFSSSR